MSEITNLNDIYIKLTNDVKDYFVWRKKTLTYHTATELNMPASKLRETIDSILPELAETIRNNDPDFIYIENLLDRVVQGLNDPTAETIWNKHYKAFGTIEDTAKETFLSSRSIARQAKALPGRITKQLWRLNAEIKSEWPLPALQTKDQKRIALLIREYKLTQRQAEVLLQLCRPGKHIGLQKTADILYMSIETLRSHLKKIRKRLETKTSWDASRKAQALLDRHNLGWN